MRRWAGERSGLRWCGGLLAATLWLLALPALAQQAEPAGGVTPSAICIDCEPDPPPANVAPSVSLTAPMSGQVFVTGSSVAFAATASDSDGGINRVEFLVDGAVVAQDTSSPYGGSWTATTGSHTVQARAVDNLGATKTTAAIGISVNANQLPAVSLTAPTSGQVFVTGSSVAFAATASDSDGSINRVEFLVDGAEVGQDTSSPYTYSWTATTGSHTVQARAIDNLGATKTTTAIGISVNANQLPAVTLTEPDGGEHYVTASSVAFTATASDSDGSVNRVEFLVDGAEIAQDTSSPYGVSWTAVAGSHTVQARAVDNLGASRTTTAVTVTVAANTAPSVALTAPVNGQTLLPGSTVALTATASDLEGSVNRVEFLVDGTEIAQDTSSPYSVAWTAAAGSHTIAARAVDNLGASRTTAAITVTGQIAGTLAGAARQYVYDQYQRLCKVIEPETGATLMGYDGAGNLAWSASGLPAATACDAEGDTAAILPRRVLRQYDARNRLVALRFPGDGLGDQDWTYTADGLPAQIVTYNGPAHTQAVSNAYGYNRRRLLTGESVTHADGSTWAVGYGYDGNAHLATQTYPDARVVQYAPNALGQATRADAGGSNPDAWGASYYPNGALKQFTYGNGIVHTLTQNARGLPERSTDAYGATKVLDDAYDYDGNGNVAAITDGATVDQRGNRDMSYDGLDRLKTVVSPMYGATGAAYGYDSLDNLTRVVLSDRDHYYCYDASNRLTNVKLTPCNVSGSVIGLQYDLQGNLANKNGVLYAFDYGNRLRGVTYAGNLVEAYQYDGHGRRVQAQSPAGAIASFYSQGEQLLYQDNGRDGKTHSYVYLAGSLVNEITRDTATGATANRYQHTDALGGPVAVTNGSRVALEPTHEYEPYGRQLTPTPKDGPGYTGHVYDAATGLSYMQQRYYDPVLGLFVSVDPMPVDMSNGSNFNRYWYANSNPLTLMDPDGRATCADKKCETSTIDPVLPKHNSQPPPVNGTEGLPPKIADKVNDGYATTVTFRNDDPKGADPNQAVQTSTAVMVEHAISDASVSSVNINSTTGGRHGVHSNHARGRAVDINRVNGQRVHSSNAAATQIQIAARNGGKVRENFGPTIMEKTSVPGGSPHHVDNASLARDHQNHIHLSGQP